MGPEAITQLPNNKDLIVNTFVLILIFLHKAHNTTYGIGILRLLNVSNRNCFGCNRIPGLVPDRSVCRKSDYRRLAKTETTRGLCSHHRDNTPLYHYYYYYYYYYYYHYKHIKYIIKTLTDIAIRTTYYVFCKRGKDWNNPELLFT